MEISKIAEKDSEDLYPRKNLYDLFRQNVDKNRSHPIAIFHGKHISYYAALSMVDSVAETLKKRFIVSKGDNVGIALQVSPQFLIAFLAIQKIGGVAIPLDPEMASSELKTILGLVSLKAIFCTDTTKMAIENDSGISAVILTRMQDFLPFEMAVSTTARNAGRHAKAISREIPHASFSDILYESKGEQESTDFDNDPSVILIAPFKSGELEAMVFTSSNLISSAAAISRNLQPIRERFRIAAMLPPHVPSSFLLSIVLPVFLGGSVLCTYRRESYSKLFQLCSLFDCDYLVSSPYDLMKIIDEKIPALAVKNLKGALSNTFLLNDEIRSEFEKNYGTHILEYCGPSEMLGVSFMQSSDRARRKAGSPGFTIPWAESRIVDESNHGEVASGATGELLVRGPQMSKNFASGKEAFSSSFIDDYFDTGDLARVDADGMYFVEERKTEIIFSQGIPVGSREVENAISSVDAVSDVAVIGVDNRKGQEEIYAIISIKTGSQISEAKILGHCSKMLSRYKVPGHVEFRQDLPKNMAGKILKRQLLEEHRSKTTA